jgi:hypothetical protein
MDALQRAAFLSVGMASGYAFLAIFCVVFGFMFAPPLATFIGGVLCLMLALALRIKAILMRTKPYDKTHLWLVLGKDDRPPAAVAQRVVTGVLTETYARFTRHAVVFGGVFLAMSISLHAFGIDEYGLRQTTAMQGTPGPVLPALPDPQVPTP